MALQVNVTRHPYSFVGDRAAQPEADELDGIGTSADGLRVGDRALPAATPGVDRAPGRPVAGWALLAARPVGGHRFDLEVVAQYQPVESQRLLLWAARQGRQEPCMSALNRLHFEGGGAPACARRCSPRRRGGARRGGGGGLPRDGRARGRVWRSYGDTIRRSGIRAIPLFAFSVPSLGAVGGPFRRAGEYEAYVVSGSSNAEDFLELFELVLRDERAGQRVYDEAAFPFRRDAWWAKTAKSRA